MEEQQRWVQAPAQQRVQALVLPLERALESQQEQERELALLQELLRLQQATVYRTNCKKQRY